MRKSDESDESHNPYLYVKKSRIRKCDECDEKSEARERSEYAKLKPFQKGWEVKLKQSFNLIN